MAAVPADVFTADELARAAGVSQAAVDAMIAAGELRLIARTHLIAPDEAVRAGVHLRRRVARSVAETAGTRQPIFDGRRSHAPAERPRSLTVSAAVHAIVLLTILLWRPAPTSTAAATPPEEPPRMVFMMIPGPGGGGGGGGTRTPAPPVRLERKGPERNRVPVPVTRPERVLAATRPVEEPPKPAPAVIAPPKPVERPPDPLPSRAITAPVVAAAPSPAERPGVIETARNSADSQGPGIGGGAGTGQGTGTGEGRGNGLGDGSGGGTGGGPYRPGSGIEPPRLLREVKADYTDEGRRRGITGDVVLEIVVRRDGSVGDITVLRGLPAGLDQRATAAVRQWRFSPARRQGEAVDVVVEVAVEFTLR